MTIDKWGGQSYRPVAMFSTRPSEFRKSFVGGFLGGALGYAIGGILESAYVSMALFFLCAYVGYDIRHAVTVMRTAWRQAPQVVMSTGRAAIVHSLSGIKDVHEETGPFGSVYCVWTVIISVWMMLRMLNEGIGAWWVCLFISVMLGIALATIATVATGVVIAVVYFVAICVWEVLKRIAQLPVTLGWLAFFIVATPTIGLAMVCTRALVLMYTFKRLVCAVTTLASGAAFLWLAPFDLFGDLFVLMAIACGTCCGAASVVALSVVGWKAVNLRLRAFSARAFTSFSPFPVPKWVTELS